MSENYLFILGKLHVITEFCSGGNLRQFLINSRVDSFEENSTRYIDFKSTLGHRQLLKIAVDIANGMVHLSSQKVYFGISLHMLSQLINTLYRVVVYGRGVLRRAERAERFAPPAPPDVEPPLPYTTQSVPRISSVSRDTLSTNEATEKENFNDCYIIINNLFELSVFKICKLRSHFQAIHKTVCKVMHFQERQTITKSAIFSQKLISHHDVFPVAPWSTHYLTLFNLHAIQACLTKIFKCYNYSYISHTSDT